MNRNMIAILICLMLIIFAMVMEEAKGEEVKVKYYNLETEYNRNQITKMCDELYENYTSHRYFCIMGNFYALDKVNDYLYDYASDAEAVQKLLDLIQMDFWLDDLECVNFIGVDREFNRWLEERE